MSKNKSKTEDNQAEESPKEDDVEAQPDLEQQIERLSADLKRAQADFVNLKRRSEQDLAKRATMIKVDVVRNLLPVLDSLERATTQKPPELEDNDWANGIDAIAKQLNKVLSDYGVERIETKDAEFNPNLHEAVSMDDSGEGDKEVVSEELQAGYTLGDTVIRHAMVVVGKKK